MPDSASFDSGTGSRSRHWWRELLITPSRTGRRWLIAGTFVLVAMIGAADFIAGFELSLLVFYILPVCLAVAADGWRLGSVVSVLCVASWLIGDIVAGASYVHPSIPWWNALFALGTYFFVVWLFNLVLTLRRELEERVRRRTAALTRLIAERERLEKELLDSGERERKKIGDDLHDDLGQHLTGTALAAQVLTDKIQSRQLAEEEADALELIDLIEEAIEKTRRLSRGLLLAEIQRDGLVGALQELAADTASDHRVRCRYDGAAAVALCDNNAATQMFRIAQEAVRNAVKHGHPSRIDISLTQANGLLLRVRDDGAGFQGPREGGLGLRIMAHRAEIAGGTFTIEPAADGGTCVMAQLPPELLAHYE